MKLKSISPSRISTFDLCHFKYFLTYHLKEKLKTNYGALNGSIIHSILENYAKKANFDWMQQLYEGFSGNLQIENKFGEKEILESPLRYAAASVYKDVKPHCDLCPFADLKSNQCNISKQNIDKLAGCPKKLFEESIDLVRSAIEKYKDAFETRLIATELKVTFELPGCLAPITAIIDLVLRRDDHTIEVIDYKAGKSTKNFEECRSDIQVRTCSLAARKYFIENGEANGFPGITNIMICFDYFRDKPIRLAFTPEEDAETARMLVKKSIEIKSQKNVTRIAKPDYYPWECKALCDIDVCKKLWKKPFKLDENDEIINGS